MQIAAGKKTSRLMIQNYLVRGCAISSKDLLKARHARIPAFWTGPFRLQEAANGIRLLDATFSRWGAQTELAPQHLPSEWQLPRAGKQLQALQVDASLRGHKGA